MSSRYVCNQKQAINFRKLSYTAGVPDWSFLANHARVLLCIARDSGLRLRDIAASLDITERTAHGIVTDLAQAGYVVKQKAGRRNRYQIQSHLPLPEPGTGEPAIGEILAVLLGETDGIASLTGPDAAARMRAGPVNGTEGITAHHGALGDQTTDDAPSADPPKGALRPAPS
jgi:hypothetical protein